MNAPSSVPDIAIVGMSALFPKAPDLQTYWQNIVNKVCAIEPAPAAWSHPYLDPDSSENDRIYNAKGGFLGELATFDPIRYGIMPNSVDGGEPVHFLGLRLAWEALQDAGYLERPFNREKTGIILGRGTYVNRGYNTLLQHGLVVDQTLTLLRQLLPQVNDETLEHLRQDLKASLPPFNTAMAPGLTPNVLTGRIANRLDLQGPNYLVDAACSSSLVAVDLAMQELRAGRCDMVLTGGVHASTPPQINMIFCRLGALTRGDLKPFDQAASGTLLGEGLGILVLKRRADAERDGDRIYALLKSTGIASDGKALGLLAPRLEGEILALERAYRGSQIDPATVKLVEAHGTGIPLGDQTEIQSLTHLFGLRQGELPDCAIGSVKSMIGHCIPASGAASLIKMALALYHKVLPPTLCDQLNPDLGLEQTPLYLNTATRPWIHHQQQAPRRAGVNAFGFGGINAHVVLEEYPAAGVPPQLHTQWPTELLVLAAASRSALVSQVQQLQTTLTTCPRLPLAVLARSLSAELSERPGPCRLAIVAADRADLATKLDTAFEQLVQPDCTQFSHPQGLFYSEAGNLAIAQQTALLFPGEGSQYANMLADLCLYFPQVREWFDFLDTTYSDRDYLPSQFIFPAPTGLSAAQAEFAQRQLFGMDLASETVFTASMALHELLTQLGVQASAMVGHSTGEFAALMASGTVRWQSRADLGPQMRYLNQIYQTLEQSNDIPRGILLNVAAVGLDRVHQLIQSAPNDLFLAIDNCPNQIIVFCKSSAQAAFTAAIQQAGGICLPLPFDRAYHTPLFEPVGRAFRAFYDALDVGPGHTQLYSCATGDRFPQAPAAIRAVATQQWSQQVRFREMVETLFHQGIRTFVEIGPGSNLTHFVGDILRQQSVVAIASNDARRPGLQQLQTLLAQLFVQGAALNLSPLYEHRQMPAVPLATLPQLEAELAHQPPVLDLTMPIAKVSATVVQAVQQQVSQTASASAPPPAPPREQEVVAVAAEPPPAVPPPIAPVALAPPVAAQPTDRGGAAAAAVPVPPPVSQSAATREPSGPPQQPGPAAASVPAPVEPPSQPLESFSAPHSSHAAALLMQRHFELMQDLLLNQSRIATAFHYPSGLPGPNDSPPPPPVQTGQVTGQPQFPLLGELVHKNSEQSRHRRCFALEQDWFLLDHTLGGQPSQRHPELQALPVMPFTLSMEILAEAAVELVGGDRVVAGLENIRGYRWLALDQGQLHLEIDAHLLTDSPATAERVQVRVYQLGLPPSPERILAFEGIVLLSDRYAPPASPPLSPLQAAQPSRWSDAELYATGMFHGPKLQGVKHIRGWNSAGIEADMAVMPINHFFAQHLNPTFQIDAGLLDAVGQLLGYWVSEQVGMAFNVFPFQVDAFYQYQPPLPAGSYVLGRGQIALKGERFAEATFEMLDAQGNRIARLEGWQDRYFKAVPENYYQCRLHPQTAFFSTPWLQAETALSGRYIAPLAEGFLDDAWGIWKRVLAHLMLTATEREFWYRLPQQGPRQTEWLMGRIAAKDAVRQQAWEQFQLALAPVDIEVMPDEAGKPIVHCPELASFGLPPQVSISHSNGHAVAVAAPATQSVGIDFQVLSHARAEDVMGLALSAADRAVFPDLNHPIAIGLWAAKEAAAKALGVELGDPKQWLITAYSNTQQIVTVQRGDHQLAVKLWYFDDAVFALTQNSNNVAVNA